MLKNLISGLLCGILYISAAEAQVCTRLPTCEELGFSKSEAECNGKSMVRCPLNKGVHLHHWNYSHHHKFGRNNQPL